MLEEIISKKAAPSISASSLQLFDLGSFDHTSQPNRKISGIGEFDRVVGGGMVIGSTLLFYGEPGIGKSTLLLQIADAAAQNGLQCLYATGEESALQIKLRAQRLGISNSNIKLLASTNLSEIIATTKAMPKNSLLIVDSIQTVATDEIDSSPGTISQTKSCILELTRLAKELAVIVLVIGHVTKEGQVAGPKLLEHMVDTVLSFEGEGTHQYRIIRAIKNRYGSTNEIAVFSMGNRGLAEVTNPSRIFISGFEKETIGSCIFAGHEGSRSLMLEVQALVAKSFVPAPRRAAVGWDNNRLAMIIAILISRLNLRVADKEVYLNIAGGLRINEPAIDLAGAVAIISAAQKIPVPRDTAFFGEIGLLGELRQVNQVESRLNEAVKLGFSRVVMPNGEMALDNNGSEYPQLKIIRANNISEVIDFLIAVSPQRTEQRRRSSDEHWSDEAID